MNAFNRTVTLAGLILMASASLAFAQATPAAGMDNAPGISGAGNISSDGPAAATDHPAATSKKTHRKNHKAKMATGSDATSPGTKTAPNANNPHATVTPGNSAGVQQYKGN